MKINLEKIPKTILLWGILIGSVIVTILSIRSCNIKKNYNNSLLEILNYEDTIKIYKSRTGQLVEYNKALKTDITLLASINDSLSNHIKNIKIPKPDVIVKTKTKTIIDSIPAIKFITVNGVFDTVFNINNEHYSITGNVNNKKLSLDSIIIPNNAIVVVGEKNPKWWRNSEYIVTVENSNPYVNNTGIKSYTFTGKNKNWSIGPSFGYGVCLNPLQNNLSHGFTLGFNIVYDLINF